MVPAPRGGLPTHTWLCAHGTPWDVLRAVMVWSQKCPDAPRAPHAPPPTATAAPQSLHDDSVEKRGVHTSGSPREKSQDSLTCPPRLQGCRYPRKRNTSRRLKKVDRERHSVSRPGSVTISFKNRCRLAVGMPFLQKFALIVWVRIPPGTLSETVEQTDPPQFHQTKLTLTLTQSFSQRLG